MSEPDVIELPAMLYALGVIVPAAVVVLLAMWGAGWASVRALRAADTVAVLGDQFQADTGYELQSGCHDCIYSVYQGGGAVLLGCTRHNVQVHPSGICRFRDAGAAAKGERNHG